MADHLFDEFPPVNTERWEEVITKDLKGADYQKKLVWRTQEGFSVNPYYRAQDNEALHLTHSDPGEYPYTRGTRATNDWLIYQKFSATGDLSQANAAALDALLRGANAVGFDLCGRTALSREELDVLLKDIDLVAAEVSFVGCASPDTSFVDTFFGYAKDHQSDLSQIKAHFDFPVTPENAAALAALAQQPGFPAQTTLVGVDGYRFHQKGATIVQELVFAFAMAKEYIERLVEAGLRPKAAGDLLQFNLSVGSNYFMEIAKLRAARTLWANMGFKIRIHAITSTWNQTVYDRYVNLLRGTTEAMSAVLSGVDSLEVTPFNASLNEDTSFGRRLARNTQLILKEEAHFDKVIDVAAGSYYIEHLTHSICAAFQTLFDALRAQGGFTAALQSGEIDRQVQESAQKKAQLIATRRETLLGVNQFPNFTEKAPQGLTQELLEASTRGATAFEKLRFKTDCAPFRPKAFMLTFGNLAMCRARAQFSCNFFAVAGIEVIDNNRFETLEEGIEAALASGAQIVVACSHDDEYEAAVPILAKGLAGKAILVVAGDPACKETLQSQGITHFISVRNNVLETLTQYQKELGL